jgi:hypothetical protein
MEYFLLDPSYACRRPALFRYYKEHFGWAPKQDTCANTYAFLNAGNDFAKTRWARSTRSASTKSTTCWPKPTRTWSAAGATACCAW